MKKLTVAWLSAGISSFVAAYLIKDEIDEFVYIDIDDQHPDSLRFIKDCEKLLGKPITILKDKIYGSVDKVCRSFGFIKHQKNGYAVCTNILKKRVRKEQWEYAHRNDFVVMVWGFDCSPHERARAERIVEAMPDFEHRFPLIENNMTKQDAHGLSRRVGLKRPKMYDMGYNNNNCIGCVKGGMGYWNKIRKDFPEVFESRAKLERDLGEGNRILKECYLDELDPNRGNASDEILEDCGIFCELNLRRD